MKLHNLIFILSFVAINLPVLGMIKDGMLILENYTKKSVQVFVDEVDKRSSSFVLEPLKKSEPLNSEKVKSIKAKWEGDLSTPLRLRTLDVEDVLDYLRRAHVDATAKIIPGTYHGVKIGQVDYSGRPPR